MNLVGVHPNLIKVVRRARELIDFTVIEGRRTLARQKELYAQGRTKPGAKVTWTLKSKHIDGKAVDCVTIINGAVDWKSCDRIAKAMLQASKELGIPIRWGADWDGDGVAREKGEGDSPHFELVG